MQVLEKILEGIDTLEDKEYVSGKYHEYFIDGANCVMTDVRAIIRRYMDDGEDTDVPTNGWIPCSKQLPDPESYVLCCFENGAVDALWQNWKEYGCGGIGGYYDDDFKPIKVIAWQPLPDPYKPVETKPAKNTQQEMEDFWRDK